MLDGYVDLSANGNTITKLGSNGIAAGINGTDYIFVADGTVQVITYQNSSDADSLNGTLRINDSNGTVIEEIPNVPQPAELVTQYPNGTSAVWSSPPPKSTIVYYYPNGTITIRELSANDLFTAENGSDRISQVEPYSPPQLQTFSITGNNKRITLSHQGIQSDFSRR